MATAKQAKPRSKHGVVKRAETLTKAASRPSRAKAPPREVGGSTSATRVSNRSPKSSKTKADEKSARGNAVTRTPVDADVGAPVPDFRLLDQGGRQLARKELLGHPFVLYFYPKDDTPGCTVEACDFRDRNPKFEKLRCRVVGVSPDGRESHTRFADKYDLGFTLLSDPDQILCKALGVWQLKKNYGREYMGVVRSTFLVDAKGRIARAWRGVKVKGHADEVLEALKAL
jgi:peroxiredoxin Q/BCP